MKKIIYMSLSIALFTALYSCSVEEIVADTPSNTDDVYKRRLEGIKNMFTTTVFTYTSPEEIIDQMPNAMLKIENFSHDMMRTPFYEGSTDAVYKIVAKGGEANIYARHILNIPEGKMIESSYKPAGTHNLHVLPREKYQETYTEVTDALANEYSNLGDYSKTGTVAALNNYLDKNISTADGSAELYIKIGKDKVEIYAPQ